MADDYKGQVLEISPEAERAHVKRIWRAFWIISVLTILELAFGLWIYFLDKGEPSPALILFIKLCIITFTIGKAFYIITIFMHLGDELKMMIMSIGIPMTLFIWFIISFLWDGSTYKVAKNTEAGLYQYEQQEIRHQPLNIPPGAEKKYKLD